MSKAQEVTDLARDFIKEIKKSSKLIYGDTESCYGVNKNDNNGNKGRI